MKKNYMLNAAIAILFLPAVLNAQVYFPPLDTNNTSTTVVVPASPLKYDVLFIGNYDYVHINGGSDSALAKQNHDFIGMVPIGSGKKRVKLIVNHEITNTKNTKLGDGGGQTAFTAKKTGDTWAVEPSIFGKKFANVDFTTLGGTNTNCGGAVTPYGTTLTAEEFPVSSNASLYASGTGYSDTSNYTIPPGNGIYSGKVIKRYQQMGWMTEVNPNSAIAIKKYYSMGRFSHEGAWCMSDGKTVYLTDDFTPAVLFKFVADVPNNYTNGQLYAYKQGLGGIGGEWLTLPMDFDSLLIIRDVAFRKGATSFTRLEWDWANYDENILYFTETGADVSDHNSAILKGGAPAAQILRLDTIGGSVANNILTDYYGRVWQLDLTTLDCSVLIEGGNGSDGKTNFSSPDGLAYISYKNGDEFLFINEDLIGASQNRQPNASTLGTAFTNEIYALDLSIANPTVDDLARFVIGPEGCETTGGTFSTDGKTYFVNIQHPAATNAFPFNNSTTIAVSGFDTYIKSLSARKVAVEQLKNNEAFTIYPNPASREIYLNEACDISIYDLNGKIVLSEINTSKVNIQGLSKGIYFVQTNNGDVQKIVIE